MINRGFVKSRLAESTMLNPMTWERIFRALVDAGLLPKGGAGRGPSVQLDAGHYACLYIALAGHDPSDGPGAVDVLRPLWSDDHQMTFFAWISREITLAATPEGAARIHDEIVEAERHRIPTRCVTLSLHPPSVQVWTSEIDPPHFSRYSRSFHLKVRDTASNPEPSSTRTTTNNQKLLLTMGQLLEASLPRQQDSTPNSKPGAKSASRKQKAAATRLCQEANATALDQPETAGPDGAQQPHLKVERTKAQSSLFLQVGSLPQPSCKEFYNGTGTRYDYGARA